MRELYSEIYINATEKHVWDVLTDYENYPNWNPFIKKISGDRHTGGKIEAYIHAPDAKAMTFNTDILVFEEKKELRWIGRLLIPGIFDGEHYFQIQKFSDNQVLFVQGEIFKGVLVPFMSSLLDKAEVGFQQMNEALKAECEKALV